MPGPEATLESRGCGLVKKWGVSNLKLEGQHNRGKSDRIFMKGGVVAFVEFKAKGKKPTKLQLKFLEDRRADGFAATWVDNLADFIAFIRETFDV